MKKILLCSPYNGIVGGISHWAKNILDFSQTESSGSRTRLSVFSMNRQKGVYANTIWLKRLAWGITDYMRIIIRYREEISTNKYDIVHIASSASISLIKDLIMIKQARKRGVATVVHFHFGRIPKLFENNNWERKLLIKVVQLASKVIVIDQDSYNILINNGYKNIFYLSNPISSNIIQYITKHGNIKRIPRKIVFAGHVVKTKGIFELVEAIDEIKDVKLFILGKISAEIKTELLSRTERDWRISIIGECSLEKVLSEMLSAQIFILPSYTEGFPNVILEAMACACSIIATNVGAIPQMLAIDGQNDCGIIVNPKSSAELKDAIKLIISNPELANLIGMRAKKRVLEEYSIQKIWSDLEHIWQV